MFIFLDKNKQHENYAHKENYIGILERWTLHDAMKLAFVEKTETYGRYI